MAAFLKAASFLFLLSPFFVSVNAQFGTVGGFYGPGSNSLDPSLNDILRNPNQGNNNDAPATTTTPVDTATTPNTPTTTTTSDTLPGMTFQTDPQTTIDESRKRDFPINFQGSWKVVSANSYVSAMHMNLLPNNKMIMFDASAFHISQIKLPNGRCLPFKTDQGATLQDCWAHGVEYDIETAEIRPLTVRNTTPSPYS